MGELYPKDPRDNKIFRLDFLKRCETDLAFRKSVLIRCELNPLFFINVLCWTYDPRREGNGESSHLPFITYPYQDAHILKTIKAIEDGVDLWTEKSRDMGYSWMIVVIQLWGWRFKKWSSLYGSYKENYVDEKGNLDSHFERLRYVIDRLPKWMMTSDYVTKYMSISSIIHGCDIAGDSGENFGIGGRRKFVVPDEFALWQFDEKAYRKTRDITNCRLFGGTPEGKFNTYGKVMTNHPDYAHIEKRRSTLHWTLHPHKAKGVFLVDGNKPISSADAFYYWSRGRKVSSPWYEDQKTKRTPLDLAKEIDISYVASVSNRVYPEFERKIRVGKFAYEESQSKVLISIWDYGLDMVSILWIEKDLKTNRNKIIDAIQKKDTEIAFFAAFITGHETPGYVYSDEEKAIIKKHYGWKYLVHIGDPYNKDARNVVKKSSVVDELAKFGVHIRYPAWEPKDAKRSSVQERISKATLRLNSLDIDEALFEYREMMMQARYPKVREGSETTSERTIPVHDDTSHFRTTTEYYFDNEPFGQNIGGKSKREHEKDFENWGI